MSKVEEHRLLLRSLDDWDAYLLAHSGLPGPRANLELVQAVAEEGDLALFRRYLAYPPDHAPVISTHEFLVFCGVVGLGRLAAEGRRELLPEIRRYASDHRWRVREGVAMAMQRLGDADMEALLIELASWSRGNYLERRAAVASICEPRLLKEPEHARAALGVLDEVTASILPAVDRRSEDFLALRKGLGYGWSVAVVALPEEGKVRMEHWLTCPDRDVQWVMRENLKKHRLKKMDPAWVERRRGSAQ